MARQDRLAPEPKKMDRARQDADHALPVAQLSIPSLRSAGEPRARHTVLLAGLVAVALVCVGCAKKVPVPDVSQQDVDQAKQALTAAGLKAGNVTGVQGDIPPGSYVVSQVPAAGTQAEAGSPVDLQIEAPTMVPDFTKSNVTDAVNTLQELGLKVALIKGPSEGLFKGPQVTAQSPAANTPVHRGSQVTLTVSTPSKVAQLVETVAREAAYSKLKPEYRQYVDDFFGPNNKPPDNK